MMYLDDGTCEEIPDVHAMRTHLNAACQLLRRHMLNGLCVHDDVKHRGHILGPLSLLELEDMRILFEEYLDNWVSTLGLKEDE